MSEINNWNIEDPEIRRTIERLKWEIAQEYGIPIPADGYWGMHASKDLGKIGSQLQKRLPLLLEYQNRSMIKKKQATRKSKNDGGIC